MIVKANSLVWHVIQIKNVKVINANVSVRSVLCAINPGTCIYENNRYSKSITDGSVIVRDEIMSVADNVSTNVTNTISKNATSAVSINSDDK